MINKVFNMDCLEGMQMIPDKSIDMILCDLPYGTTACKWDVIIPFEPLWKQYERVIKDNGAIVLTASQPFTSALVMSNTKMFKYEWIWDKKRVTGFQTAKIMPMKGHENVLVFYKSTPIYNPQLRNVKKPFGKTTQQTSEVIMVLIFVITA
jgi:site-specific DNA-methyltransferase (adenine-specific)